MWPLSCYAYSKERENVPGFLDHSPEELRWHAYQAMASGTATQHTEFMKSLEETQIKLWRDYSSILPADVTKLV